MGRDGRSRSRSFHLHPAPLTSRQSTMSRRRPADETASPPRRLQQLLSYQGPVVDVARVPARRGNECADERSVLLCERLHWCPN